MVALSVWTFDSPDVAECVVRDLRHAAVLHLPGWDDVAAVSWPEGQRRPLAWQERSLAGPGVLSGAFWGMLFGCLFLLPLAVTAGAGEEVTMGAMAPLGLDGEFMDSVRALVTAGSSAVFVLCPGTLVDNLAEIMAPYRAQLLVRSFIDDQESRLRAAFADDD
jgi:uncharacterized membrane protein